MNLEFLIATMDRKSLDFLSAMNVNDNKLIINQSESLKSEEFKLIPPNTRYLSYREKGLSRSRNRALQNAEGDICILADDDLRYMNDVKHTIIEAYQKYKDADVIVFQISNSKGQLYKSYSNRAHRINRLTSMKVSSVEITFRRKSIIDKGINFNEKFGAGSKYYCGEENIFLKECMDKHLKIMYVPKVIAQLEESESSWFRGYDDKYFRTKGAVFYKLFSNFYPLIILQFAIRKRNLFKKEIHIYRAILLMLQGAREVKREEE